MFPFKIIIKTIYFKLLLLTPNKWKVILIYQINLFEYILNVIIKTNPSRFKVYLGVLNAEFENVSQHWINLIETMGSEVLILVMFLLGIYF